jgi:hypothetical protein
MLPPLPRSAPHSSVRSAGGFNPGRVLPCVIDVGTNNELLRQEPWWVLLLRYCCLYCRCC